MSESICVLDDTAKSDTEMFFKESSSTIATSSGMENALYSDVRWIFVLDRSTYYLYLVVNRAKAKETRTAVFFIMGVYD